MTEKTKIGIVILNYQSYKDTIKLLKNLYEINKQLVDKTLITCVVDNCSPNNSVDLIEQELRDQYRDEPFFLLPLKSNLGYSSGNNAGIKFLLEKKCRYIFIMNNDIEIENENFFNSMLESIKYNNAAILGPGIIQNGKMELPLKGKRPSFVGIVFENFFLPIKIIVNKYKRRNLKYKKEAKRVYSVSGCCFLIDAKKTMDNGNFFDDRLFLYEEETILGERMFREKQKIFFDPSTSVIHAHGATIKKHYDKKKQDAIRMKVFSYI